MAALSPEMLLVLAILAGTVALFVTELVRVDVAAIIVMVVLGLTGLVPTPDLFAGFASNAVISIIAIMILAGALDRTGVMRIVAEMILRVGGVTERRIGALISLGAGGISGFMQNIGAAALFLPITDRVSERTGLSASRLLMPMGFAAILGGTLTLVASGPLILLNDLLAGSAGNLGIEITPYGLFAPTPIGLVLLLTGLAFFATVGQKLIPRGETPRAGTDVRAHLAESYGLAHRVRPVRVPPGSPLIGRDVESVEAEWRGVKLTAMVDEDGLRVAPPREVRIAAEIVLALGGGDAEVGNFIREHDLEPTDPGPLSALGDETRAGLAEVVVRPGSPAVGRKLRELRLRKRLGLNVLAIHRGGEVLTGVLREVELASGDVLVLFSTWDRLAELDADSSFVVVSDHPRSPPRWKKVPFALGFFALSLILVLTTELQLSLALMAGAAGILATGTLTPDEAYRAISWKTVFLLAALIPLGQAVEESGTAAWIAEGVISVAGGLPSWGMQLVIAVLATAFTLIISNVGATVLLVPLAVNVAVGIGADPAQFGLIVAIAVSNAFLLPTHQVNALLMGPGGYRVRDFLKAGGALTFLFLLVLIPAVNLFT